MPRRQFHTAFDAVLNALKINYSCGSCGGRAAMTGRMIVMYRGDPDPSRCRECGLLLHANGQPAGYIGVLGKPVVHVIDLRGNYAWADDRPHDPSKRIENCLQDAAVLRETPMTG